MTTHGTTPGRRRLPLPGFLALGLVAAVVVAGLLGLAAGALAAAGAGSGGFQDLVGVLVGMLVVAVVASVVWLVVLVVAHVRYLPAGRRLATGWRSAAVVLGVLVLVGAVLALVPSDEVRGASVLVAAVAVVVGPSVVLVAGERRDRRHGHVPS
ncbi:hypothetical protein [Cellulomonas marina]|uniref:Uncharacterized protein n=1 Tax=Cellulomonas marina TaxID=988821 RepID=A0A1I0Y038_9CELL|nr:hypothetical protein [Cellulomonas marina]GIG28421.1 hypothetical protein Cma02nite_10210 [Cellulomonas marina]SFB06681.1 hypothetical protein SAMN05421867_10699 [Cellulomonas marina]